MHTTTEGHRFETPDPFHRLTFVGSMMDDGLASRIRESLDGIEDDLNREDVRRVRDRLSVIKHNLSNATAPSHIAMLEEWERELQTELASVKDGIKLAEGLSNRGCFTPRDSLDQESTLLADGSTFDASRAHGTDLLEGGE